MTYFLCRAQGLLNGSFPWSFGSVMYGTESESSSQTAWDNAVQALWTNATLAPYIPALTTLTETSTSTATPTFTQSTKTITTHNIAGTATDTALGYRTCEVVTFTSVFATKWGRGRWYLPSLAYNALSADGYSMLAAAQTAIVDGVNAFFSSLGSTLQMQILHRKAPLSGAVTAYSTSVVNGGTVPNTFATQRRRADKIVPTRSAITV
jgi:hypothetical protein